MEITEGHSGPRDYLWCLKRRNDREGGLLCPSFFLPAGSRDDGVCPRGRSILLESCGSRASLAAGDEGERERARVGSLSRGPRGHAGPARNGHLKRGRNGRGAPRVFLTRIPDVRASHLLILLPFSLHLPLFQLLLLFSRPLHYHSASWSSRSFRLFIFLLDRHHLLFLFA